MGIKLGVRHLKQNKQKHTPHSADFKKKILKYQNDYQIASLLE